MSAEWGAEAAVAAATVIRRRLTVGSPVAAIVLGSGLGDLAARLSNAKSLEYADIPGFAAPSVDGHAGRLIIGTLGGREIVALAGRFHMYEGHIAKAAAFPMRVMHALGVQVVFASNASGGLNPSFEPGDLVLIDDQINLTGQNPLTGAAEPGDFRFPDMSAPYSPRLKSLLRTAAGQTGVTLKSGVYVGLMGPVYETPAEVRMLQRLGADLTGMSTVGEAIVAAALGMEFVAVSLVTNKAAGLTNEPVRHEDVMVAAGRAAQNFGNVVEQFVQLL